MPIRNMGTLLENIVVVEAMRLLARDNEKKFPIDFLNSFAMPPLSIWRESRIARGFSVSHLDTLRASSPPAEASSYEAMLWSCLQQPPEDPGSQGPNGALLVAMLAHHLTFPLRLWLNDVANGHYGDALLGLARISSTVRQIFRRPDASECTVVTCEQPWPDSLAPPSPNNLSKTLDAWGSSNGHARFGFLDPMRYREKLAQEGETDSDNHKSWLALLSRGFERTIISGHFTGHNNWVDLRREIQCMHQDGLESGYNHTFVGRHDHYHVVCNIKHPQGGDAAHTVASHLQEAVQTAWRNWHDAIGIQPYKLCTYVL